MQTLKAIWFLLLCISTVTFGRGIGEASFTSPFKHNNISRIRIDNGRTRKTLQETLILDLRGGDLSTSNSKTIISSSLEALDLFGTGVFAFSGAVKAGKKGMDIIGISIIATITAVGGGTIRDILMGCPAGEVFWMRETLYLKICLWVALATFTLWPAIEKDFGFRDSALVVNISDAIGLAAFGVIGTQQALKRNLAPIIWPLSGLMTATFGGLLRDIICLEPARVMYPHRTMYGVGPLMGSLVYTLLIKETSMPTDYIIVISFLIAFMVRILSFSFKSWRLPHWPAQA